MVNFVDFRFEKLPLGQVRFEKLAFSQRIVEKMVIFVNFEKWDLKSWHSDKEFVKNGEFCCFEIWKVGIQSKNLWKNGDFCWFGQVRFEKLAFKQKNCENGVYKGES